MSYSNINKDKKQERRSFRPKIALGSLFLMIILLTSLGNVYNQWKTLRQANERIADMKAKVDKMDSQIGILERQVEYATSSAGRERRVREYLGMGTENDHWIVLPKVEEEVEKVAGDKEIEQPIVWQWWEMFTK